MSLSNIKKLVFDPSLYIDGCQLQWVDDETIIVSTGFARDANNVMDIAVDSTLIASTAVSGIGGLDTGTLSTNTVYYVYLIADATGFNSPDVIFSTYSNDIPYLPKGYTNVRRVGRFMTNGSSDILKFYSYASSGRDRFIQLDKSLNLVNLGSSTTFTSFDTKFGAANGVANPVFIGFQYTPSSASGKQLFIRPYGSDATNSECPIISFSLVIAKANVQSMIQILPVVDGGGVPSLEYQVDSGDNVQIYLNAYIDRL